MPDPEMSSESSARESNPPEAFNLANTSFNCVEAKTVKLSQCSVNKIDSESVDFSNGGIQMVNAQNLFFKNGGILTAHANELNLSDGGIGIASSHEFNLTGNAGIVVSQAATVKEGPVGLLVSRDVQGTKIKTVVLLAGETHAPVETMVDQRSVALFGLAAGIAMGMVFSIFRLFKGR